jgi:hypothetical protein
VLYQGEDGITGGPMDRKVDVENIITKTIENFMIKKPIKTIDERLRTETVSKDLIKEISNIIAMKAGSKDTNWLYV